MTIKEELAAELKDAMRSGDRARREVIRQVETEVTMAKSAAGFKGDVDDDLYRKVIAAYSKKMAKAVDEYRELGDRGAEMAAKLQFEVDYLARWLPTVLSEAETRVIVSETIASLGVRGDPKSAGRVIGVIMKDHQASLDGSLVSRIVREELGA